MSSQLVLPCNCCEKEVRISNRERFLEMVRTDQRPFCEQCRRYVSPGTARVSKIAGEQEFPALCLTALRSRNGDRLPPLAGMKLKRCGASSCDNAVSVDT